MMDLDYKKSFRKANKKRKAVAYLAIAELNDQDKSKTKKFKSEEGEDDVADQKESQDKILLETSTERDLNKRLTDKPLLEGEEYEELKKKLRERKKLLTCTPGFRLKSVGEDAAITREKRIPLFMSDIQHLLTYCMIGDRAPYRPHRWTTILKWNKLTNLVCLVIDGVGIDDYKMHHDSVEWIGQHLPNLVEVVSPLSYNSTMQEEIAFMPLTVNNKRKLIEEFGSLESALEKGETYKAFRSIFPVKETEKKVEVKTNRDCVKLQLLLSATQMVTENYPLPLQGELADKYKDYKLTSEKYNEVTPSSPIYSVDCEMCLTDYGNELTRICVVDSSLLVVYHSLVKPDNPIRNYLTQYSGITAEMLDGVTTKLVDVQKALQELLPSDSILVGQSLNSDLTALKLMHPYIIDTSVCFNITGDRRRKTKLSVLAHLYLNRTIQSQGKKGHSPIEDAKAAMNLVILKLEKGLKFGDVVLGGQIPNMNEEGIYTVPEEATEKVSINENLMISITKKLAEHEKTVALVCDKSSDEKYDQLSGLKSDLKYCKSEETPGKAVEAATEAAIGHNMTICHVDLSQSGEGEERMKKAQKLAKKLYNFTSIHGMFVLLLGGTQSQNGVAGIVVRKPEDG